jgi:hypothetical protein
VTASVPVGRTPRRLTALAEAVIDAAVAFVIRTLAGRFGEPRTVAGLPGRATRIGARIMEDTLQVVDELGRAVDRLRKGRHRLAS